LTTEFRNQQILVRAEFSWQYRGDVNTPRDPFKVA
jgi:hypothetical protein